MSAALATIPSVEKAKLPTVYVEATKALEKCERVDECKDWADKAAAIASYARQMNDDEMLNFAMRIKDRATRQFGVLMAKMPANPEGRPPKNSAGTRPVIETRATIQEHLGVSDHQVKQALNIAAIPKKEFDRLVDAPEPPTLTELAQRGREIKREEAPPAKTPRPMTAHLAGRAAEDFAEATKGAGAVKEFAEEVADLDPVAVGRGLDSREKQRVLGDVESGIAWLIKLRAALKR